MVLFLRPYASPSVAPEDNALNALLSTMIDRQIGPTQDKYEVKIKYINRRQVRIRMWGDHFFCPNLSFSLSPPPLAGVDGVAEIGVLVAARGTLAGIEILGKAEGVDGVLGATLGLDCLKVIRGAGGCMPCSSRLRLALSFEGPRLVRTWLDL